MGLFHIFPAYGWQAVEIPRPHGNPGKHGNAFYALRHMASKPALIFG
jgi:hypothetical protein